MLELSGDSIELKHLQEITKSGESEFWFLDALDTIDKKVLGKIPKISIVVENSLAQFHAFPMDSSLTQVEMNEHVEWELKNYLADFRRNDYITDVRQMRMNAREQVLDVLAVSLKKSFIFDLQTRMGERKLILGSVDVPCYAAEDSLLQSHPEVKARQCMLVGLSPDRVDLGILSNAKMMIYRYQPYHAVEDGVAFLLQVAKEYEGISLYVYGDGYSFAWQKALRKEFGQRVMPLNPFRRMRISSLIAHFSKYLGSECRFACCIGSALGEQG